MIKFINFIDPHEPLADYPGMGNRLWVSKEDALQQFPNAHVEWGGTLRCFTSDGRIVNMAEELNRLEDDRQR